MQFSVTVIGLPSGDVVAQSTADALGIFNSTPQFISNDRWEIEVVPLDDEGDESDVAGEGWELLCDVTSGESREVALDDLSRVERALLAAGASNVVINALEP